MLDVPCYLLYISCYMIHVSALRGVKGLRAREIGDCTDADGESEEC